MFARGDILPPTTGEGWVFQGVSERLSNKLASGREVLCPPSRVEIVEESFRDLQRERGHVGIVVRPRIRVRHTSVLPACYHKRCLCRGSGLSRHRFEGVDDVPTDASVRTANRDVRALERRGLDIEAADWRVAAEITAAGTLSLADVYAVALASEREATLVAGADDDLDDLPVDVDRRRFREQGVSPVVAVSSRSVK